MEISERGMEKAIQEWLADADADGIATIVGFMFGGDCFATFKKNPYDGKNDLVYEFTPNEYYGGHFDELEEYQ